MNWLLFLKQIANKKWQVTGSLIDSKPQIDKPRLTSLAVPNVKVWLAWRLGNEQMTDWATISQHKYTHLQV